MRGIRPYSKRLARGLKAAPKLYLYDILQIDDRAKRRENLVALHLLNACHFWTDTAAGDFELHFVRTRDGREVDFLVTRSRKPWMLVECKSADTPPSRNLVDFAARLKTEHNFQLVEKRGYDRRYPQTGVRVMDTEAFLAGLV